MKNFSLEEISKIKWATPSDQVLDFFGCLDRYVWDASIDSSLSRPVIIYQNLRNDVVSESNNLTIEKILENAPEMEDGCIKMK